MGCLESLITVRFCVGNADSVLYLIIIVELILYFARFWCVVTHCQAGRDRSEETSEIN